MAFFFRPGQRNGSLRGTFRLLRSGGQAGTLRQGIAATGGAALFDALLPYEFSPTVLVICVGAVLFYVRGLVRPESPGVSRWRSTAFLVGVLTIYVVLQTRFDYLSQHMFFIHRIQHLVLHHLGPFLIALAAPGEILLRGMPAGLRDRVILPFCRHPLVLASYRGVQQPVVASLLFVGLIYLWLMPSIHFYAMLNVPLYNLMNWGMAIDGLLFWWLMLAPDRHSGPRSITVSHGGRILILFLIMGPQIAIGAYIAFAQHDLYGVYAICGRIWPIPARVDQQLGGLITWIPAAMMSVIGILVVLRRWTRRESSDQESVTMNAGTR